jgi:hypothetical protein
MPLLLVDAWGFFVILYERSFCGFLALFVGQLESSRARAASSAAQSTASSTSRGEFQTIVGVKIVIQARL